MPVSSFNPEPTATALVLGAANSSFNPEPTATALLLEAANSSV